MKTRAEIKAIAKENFKANYWPIVGLTVAFSLIVGALAGVGIGIIVAPAFEVALQFLYIATFFGDKESEKFETCMSVGFSNFGRNLGSILLMALMLCGWFLLFYIPGIIKAFSYAMTPYILADCPAVGAVDAITISRRMMNGHKWEYFVFILSFLGWNLLSALTFGILSIFYVTPYEYTSLAGYYVELKKLCIEQGVVTQAQFEGEPLKPVQA